MLVNRWGVGVGWGWPPANLHEVPFPPWVQAVAGGLGVLADSRFQAATGAPANRTVGRRGEGNERRLIAPVLSRLTPRSPLHQVRHRVAVSVQARRAVTMAVVTLLAPGHGLPAAEAGVVPLSSAKVSL